MAYLRPGAFVKAETRGVRAAGNALSRPAATRAAQAATTSVTPAQQYRTVTTTTPAAAVAPFLTPAQQAALSRWNETYGASMAKLDEADALALTKFNTTYAADTAKNTQEQNMTDQTMAARGLFQSSIRENALNDLAGTLAMQYNTLHTAYQTTLMNDATARGTLQGEDATNQLMYGELGVQNAQGVAPNTTPTTTTTRVPIPNTNASNAAAARANAAPAAPKLPAGANGFRPNQPPGADVNAPGAARAAGLRSAPTGGSLGRGANIGRGW